ncbi:MAG: NAD(P)H-dependent glycerol-3-phosphate dehydrogenase [Haliscomenobacter sp.]
MPKTEYPQTVAVIGAGTFGAAISNLLAHNAEVLLYSRNPDLVQEINTTHRISDMVFSNRVWATSDLEEVAQRCTLLFPVVPSTGFRSMMQQLGPFLKPYHMIIHGTKGLDIEGLSIEDLDAGLLRPEQVRTMSQVIQQESVVRRVGCLSGPNLATEILEGQPTATVIGTVFKEVHNEAKRVLASDRFHVFGTHDILGAELAGALKNVIAVGSGILRGKGLGKNMQAMLIVRGLVEMVHFGKAFGAANDAFFGTAGIGDLVATATSKKSRNFMFGYRLGKGENFQEIQNTMPELAEGVRTLKIMKPLIQHFKLKAPITMMLYLIVFEGYDIDKAIRFLMNYPYDVDVDFL